MAGGEYVPTLADIWDFLLGLKAATEAGFERVQIQLGGLDGEIVGIKGELGDIRGELGDIRGELGDIRGELGDLKGQLNRVEARLVRIESWNVDRRLDDHEQRILRLERQSQAG